MARRVVLIQPKSGVYDEVIKDIPLSLLYVAAIIKNRGYEVLIIDQRVEYDWKEKLLYELSKNPLCAGVTVMSGAPIRFGLQVSEVVKNNSRVPVVWGGIHPTILPEQTLADPMVDMVVQGDGEQTLYELVTALEARADLSGVKGLSYKVNGQLRHNPAREQIDLETIPPLPYDLINIDNYTRKGYEEKVISVMTSRGCPHNCAFCYAPAISGRRWRKLSVESSLRALELAMEKFNPGIICLLDDDFFIDKSRAKTLLRALQKKKWPATFDFRGVRIDDICRMDAETLEIMAALGTRNLHIGAESGSPRILKLMKKGITVDQIISANLKLKDYPTIHPTYNFFSGLPTETEEDIFMSTNLVFKLLEDNPNCHMTLYNQFTPYPGSELFRLSVEYGYTPPETLRDWGDFGPDNSAASLPWLTPRLIRVLNTLYITSYFIDRKLGLHLVSSSLFFKLIRLGIHCYRPLARFRFKHHFTAFPLEIMAKKLLFFLIARRQKTLSGSYFETRLKFYKNRAIVWKELTRYLQRFIPVTSHVLELGAGYCDFINNISAAQKYALDVFYDLDKYAAPDVKVFKQLSTDALPLPPHSLDVVFASHFFEHLSSADLDRTFERFFKALKPGGRLVVMQPNYTYYKKHYFDDQTHRQVFTAESFKNLLAAKGFVCETCVPRFLPATLKSPLPKSALLIRAYLHLPFKIMAGQFLIVSRKIQE